MLRETLAESILKNGVATMNKFFAGRVIRKTLEEIILKNGVTAMNNFTDEKMTTAGPWRHKNTGLAAQLCRILRYVPDRWLSRNLR